MGRRAGAKVWADAAVLRGEKKFWRCSGSRLCGRLRRRMLAPEHHESLDRGTRLCAEKPLPHVRRVRSASDLLEPLVPRRHCQSMIGPVWTVRSESSRNEVWEEESHGGNRPLSPAVWNAHLCAGAALRLLTSALVLLNAPTHTNRDPKEGFDEGVAHLGQVAFWQKRHPFGGCLAAYLDR
jgi:hypothetical protein